MSMIVDRSMAMYSSAQQTRTLTAQHVLTGRRLGDALSIGSLQIVPVLDSPLISGVFRPFASESHLQTTAFIGHIHLANPTNYPIIAPAHSLFHMENGTVQAMGHTLLMRPQGSIKIADAARVCMDPNLAQSIPHSAILPFPLRTKAMTLEGIRGSTKLWGHICHFFGELGELPKEDLGYFFDAYTPPLVTSHTFENQTGALFYWEDQLMGIELSPDIATWQSRASAVYTSYIMTLALEEKANQYAVRHNNDSIIPSFSVKGKTQKVDGYNQYVSMADRTLAGEAILHMGQVGFASLINPMLNWG